MQDAEGLPDHIAILKNRLTSVLAALRTRNKNVLGVMDCVNYALGRIFERVIINEDSFHLLPKFEPVAKMTWFVC